ncbi:MAG: acyl carrier protein [Anaerolinea sp.]|nr:acyl carrier protein [Anaerolinea sp.]MCC6975748.1 acyl carrier protein [Anaerolineae bacterium]CAG1011244.1 D-alanine--poly(phosphoribitol) ligase subunit 2 [Anaerolineae bacterium]
MDEMVTAFQKFIAADLLRDPEYQIEANQSLIKGGLIDSFSLVQVGLFIEKTWKLKVPDRDLTVERMDTIDQMVAYVQNRLQNKK